MAMVDAWFLMVTGNDMGICVCQISIANKKKKRDFHFPDLECIVLCIISLLL